MQKLKISYNIQMQFWESCKKSLRNTKKTSQNLTVTSNFDAVLSSLVNAIIDIEKNYHLHFHMDWFYKSQHRYGILNNMDVEK